MATSKNLNAVAIREDHARGLTVTQLAKKYGVRHSTIAYHLKDRTGGTEAPAPTEATDGNGHSPDGGAGLEQLTAYLDARWRSLSLLQRVRFLLKD